MDLETVLKVFLNKHLQKEKPILLGLSGGPDSICLFHLLLKIQKTSSFKLHIAHIDHGWREESAQEAAILQKMALQFNLHFHFKRLDPSSIQGNLEEQCRLQRLQFFTEISNRWDCQAVILGHHANDQAETVIKRILEGAALPHLTGMQCLTKIDELTIWRPLLHITKAEILQWLNRYSIPYFSDKTNEDPSFLRARLRTSLIPYLSETFGKEVTSPLCRLGFEAFELQSYLNERIDPYLKKMTSGSSGLFLDLSPEYVIPFELKHLLRKIFGLLSTSPSNQVINKIIELFEKNKGDCEVSLGKFKLIIDRKRLFFIKEASFYEPLEQFTPLTEGVSRYREWTINTRLVSSTDSPTCNNWNNVWRGKCEILLPPGSYFLGPPKMNTSYARCNKISKWWTNHKVPAFIRRSTPVVWEGEKIVYEFLTGKILEKPDKQGLKIQISR